MEIEHWVAMPGWSGLAREPACNNECGAGWERRDEDVFAGSEPVARVQCCSEWIRERDDEWGYGTQSGAVRAAGAGCGAASESAGRVTGAAG